MSGVENDRDKRLMIFSKNLGFADIGEDFVLIFGQSSIGMDVSYGTYTINNSKYNIVFEVENNSENKKNYGRLIEGKERVKFVISEDNEQYEFNGVLVDLIEEGDGLIITTKINLVISI